jgi:hypothetical protein
MEEQALIEKIRKLPPDRLAELEDFVESLAQRDSIVDETRLHQALAEYASQHAGSAADLDTDLEAASIDHLLREGA